MTGGNGIADIALLHFCSHTCRRAGTHDVDDDDRNFCHSRHGNGFRHKRKAGTCRCRECTDPCIACSHCHHYGRQFIFRLHHRALYFMNVLNHVFHDFRSGGNRVRRHETGTCGYRTQSSRFISQKVKLLFFRRCGKLP